MDALAIDPRPQTQHSLLQTPFVQNVLPFLTSLILHVGIVVLGIATYHAVRQVIRMESRTYIPPTMEPVPWGNDNPTKFPGFDGDPERRFMQSLVPDVRDDGGLSDKLGGTSAIPGGSEGGDGELNESMIGIGDSLTGDKHGNNRGHNGANGIGDGDVGRIGPYGPPGGGNETGFLKQRTVAARVVFICDATGSMMEYFDALRHELRKAIEPMKLTQSANVVFLQEHAPAPLSNDLLRMTPENKRKLLAYVDAETPRGPTDPLPAIKAAFAMHPDVIFFLCDPSDFKPPQPVIDLCKSLNAEKKTRIFTICFDTHDQEELLKQIASDSGGIHKFVSAHELGD